MVCVGVRFDPIIKSRKPIPMPVASSIVAAAGSPLLKAVACPASV